MRGCWGAGGEGVLGTVCRSWRNCGCVGVRGLQGYWVDNHLPKGKYLSFNFSTNTLYQSLSITVLSRPLAMTCTSWMMIISTITIHTTFPTVTVISSIVINVWTSKTYVEDSILSAALQQRPPHTLHT